MKNLVLLTFLSLSCIAFAQRKEMRTIKKAVKKGDMKTAIETFESIDETAVEDKYLGDYNLFKAAYILQLTNPAFIPTIEQLRSAEAAYKIAKDNDADQPQMMAMIGNGLLSKKLATANSLAQSGKLLEARDLVDELYQMDTENYDMLYDSANLSYKAEDFKRAFNDYDKLINANYSGVATYYLAISKDSKVAERFSNKTVRDAAVRLGSHNTPTEETTPSNVGDIAVKLIWLYKNQKSLKSAESRYNQILKKFPDDQSLKLAKPQILLTLEKNDEYEKATAAMKESINDPAVYENIGVAAFKNKDYDKAIMNFESAIDLKPSFGAHVNLSNAYIEKGNLEETTAEEQLDFYKKAVENLEKAHELKQDEKGIVATLVSLYEFLEMPEKAAAMKTKM